MDLSTLFRLSLPAAVLGIAVCGVGHGAADEVLSAAPSGPAKSSGELPDASPLEPVSPGVIGILPVADVPKSEAVGAGGFDKTEYSLESQGIMIVWSRKNGRLSGFSQQTGDWSHLTVTPQQVMNQPIVGGKVGAVRVGDTIAAFSGTTGAWDVLRSRASLKDAPHIEVASSDLVKVKIGKLLYTFAAANGKWTSPNDSNFRTSTPRIPIDAQPAPSDPTDTFSVPPAAIIPGGRNRENSSGQSGQDVLVLARKYRGKGLNDARARKVLSEAVAVAFDKRQAFQRSEAERMHAKLKQILQAIERRGKLRQRIIDRRVEELLDPNLNWDTTSADRSLPSSGLWPVDGADPGVQLSPVFDGPLGLPGPPQIPYGAAAALRSHTERSAPAEAEPQISMTWRRPAELYRELANRRRFVELSVDSIKALEPKLKAAQKPLLELKKLKDWQDMSEEDRQRSIDSVAGNIRRYQKDLVGFLGQWKQEWSLYQSQLKLLQLDVEEAVIRRDAARKDAARVRELAESGVTTTAERRKAETELAVADIALKRAELHLAPYATIEADMSELNPGNFDSEQLLNDPLRTPIIFTETTTP